MRTQRSRLPKWREAASASALCFGLLFDCIGISAFIYLFSFVYLVREWRDGEDGNLKKWLDMIMLELHLDERKSGHRDHWIARRERDIISNRSAIFAGTPAFVTSSPEFPDFTPNPRDIRRCRNLTNS